MKPRLCKCGRQLPVGRPKWCSKQCYDRHWRHPRSLVAGLGPWHLNRTNDAEGDAIALLRQAKILQAQGLGCYRIECQLGGVISYQTVYRWLRNGLPKYIQKMAEQRERELRGE